MPPTVFVSDVERIGDFPPGGKLPKVAIGKATRDPQVTFGAASGEAVQPLLSPIVRDQQLTFAQLVENMSDAAPALVIHELTGPDNRQVALAGRALPFRGSLKFIGEMRLEGTPYVGYPKVNQTVLGAQEQDTEMNGEWHDRFLLDPSEVSAVLRASVDSPDAGTIALARTELRTARDLCILFDDILVSGRLLRVSWAHIQRLGRLAIFEQDWQNLHDVKWRMKFEWVGRDDQVGLPSPTRSTIVGLAQALSSGYVDLHQATNFDDVADLVDAGYADQLDTLIGKARATIDNIGSAVETRISAATNALDAVRRSLSLATEVRDQAQNVIDSINETVAAALFTAGAVRGSGDGFTSAIQSPGAFADFTGIDPGQQIAAACQLLGAVRAARALKHIAARQRFQVLRNLESDVIAIVRLRTQEDLRDLAKQWYGTPDAWDEIRSFNGLTTSVVPAGTLIFIPTLRTP